MWPIEQAPESCSNLLPEARNQAQTLSAGFSSPGQEPSYHISAPQVNPEDSPRPRGPSGWSSSTRGVSTKGSAGWLAEGPHRRTQGWAQLGSRFEAAFAQQAPYLH